MRINGSFSHSEGDFALIRTAEVLVMTFRKSDVLARLDGDDFAVLAIESSGHSEGTIMARLRESLETVSAQEPRYPLSLRVGVVRLTPRTTRSIAELMLEVDRPCTKPKETNEGSCSPDSLQNWKMS
jgi:two-component system, cell cycle response regulator